MCQKPAHQSLFLKSDPHCKAAVTKRERDLWFIRSSLDFALKIDLLCVIWVEGAGFIDLWKCVLQFALRDVIFGSILLYRVTCFVSKYMGCGSTLAKKIDSFVNNKVTLEFL